MVGVNGVAEQFQLEWAIDAALRWNAHLLIVHCYEDRIALEIPVPDVEKRLAATAVLDHALSHARQRDVSAESALVDGFAGEALVQASKDAQLLVVGSRHRSPLSHAIHPSVTSYCVHHAQCPVTIVPLPT